MIAIPARWRDVGDVLEIREEVSESSDWSSASRRASWVVAKEGTSTAPLGAIVYLAGGHRIVPYWLLCSGSCEMKALIGGDDDGDDVVKGSA